MHLQVTWGMAVNAALTMAEEMQSLKPSSWRVLAMKGSPGVLDEPPMRTPECGRGGLQLVVESNKAQYAL